MSQLSEIQRLAVESPAIKLAIDAGAGSGKSRVVEHRIKWMIQKGEKPKDIAAITFTNYAASVLQSRIAQPIGYIGTLHSLLLRMINRQRAIGHLPLLQVADDEFCEYIFLRVKKQLKSAVTKKQFDGARLAPEKRRPTPAQELVKAYEKAILFNNCIDFDLILKLGYKFIRDGIIRKPFKHLFVDEYQDSGDMDDAIYTKLIDDGHLETITIVGDVNQSIYGFRGANPENLSKKCFVSEWKCDGAWTYASMHENYRSDRRICEVANRIYPDSAFPMSDSFGNVVLKEDATRFLDEADAIRQALKIGIPENEIAVILRTNFLVGEYTNSLSAMGFNVSRVSWMGPRDWKKMKAIVGMHIGKPSTGKCLHYLKAVKGVGEKELLSIERESTKHGKSDLALMRCQLACDIRTDLQLAGISRESMYYYGEATTMADDPEDQLFALREIELGFSRKTEGISVRTVHSAKGGEWDVVILPELVEKVFPLDEGEDERRLFYVAVTRARHFIYATVPATRITGWGMPQTEKKSRFAHYLKGIGNV